MSIYIELLMVAAITIFIVDVSGFTESWRSALSRILRRPQLRELKPFDCSLCMTWWACIVYALVAGRFSLPVLAFIALLSHLSFPIGEFLIFIREELLMLIEWMLNHGRNHTDADGPSGQ